MQFSNTPYGCHNRPAFEQTIQIYGEPLKIGGRVFPVVRGDGVPFRGTMPCQYTLSNLGQIDPGCSGCKHKVMPAPVEEPREFIVFRVDGDEDDDAEQVSIPCTREVADRYIKYKRIDQPDETFFLVKIVKE